MGWVCGVVGAMVDNGDVAVAVAVAFFVAEAAGAGAYVPCPLV